MQSLVGWYDYLVFLYFERISKAQGLGNQLARVRWWMKEESLKDVQPLLTYHFLGLTHEFHIDSGRLWGSCGWIKLCGLMTGVGCTRLICS